MLRAWASYRSPRADASPSAIPAIICLYGRRGRSDFAGRRPPPGDIRSRPRRVGPARRLTVKNIMTLGLCAVVLGTVTAGAQKPVTVGGAAMYASKNIIENA